MKNLSEWLPVSLEDRALFVSHYLEYPQVHSDNTFVNMVVWNSYANYSFLFENDLLIIASTIDEKTVYRYPVGPDNPEILKRLLRLCIESKSDEPLVIFGENDKTRILSHYPNLVLHPARDYFEYVYRSEDLASLSGGKYLTIRRQLHKFKRNCQYSVEEVVPENLDEVHEFLVRWCEWKGCEQEAFLSYERDAVFFAVEHFFSLGLSGILIRVRGRVSSVAIYEPLNPDTIVVHFEKGHSDCEGVYRAINVETALAVKDKYTYINRESDMGVDGLREAKRRYYPDHMVEVYTIPRESIKNCL